MKKKLLISFLSLTVAVFCFGQSDTILLNKKGKPILPQKGDFAVGISTNSIFDYIGNMLSSAGNNDLSLEMLNGYTLFGKYYLSTENAIRLKFSINSNFNSYSNSIVDDNNPLAKVVDKMDFNNSSFQIMPGFEKHRGTGRLQINYGGELLFGFTKYSRDFTYGNEFSEANQTPTSTYDITTSAAVYRFGTRAIGSGYYNLMFGLRGFLGLEYFILPKVAIGSEIGLAYTHINSKNYIDKIESWDYTNGEVSTTSSKGQRSVSNSINIDNLQGSIYILYCF